MAIKESQTEVGYTDPGSAACVERKKQNFGNARSRRPVGRFGRPDMFLIRTHRERSILSGFPKVYRSVIALRRLGSESSIIGNHFGVPKTVKVCSQKRSGPRGVCVEVPFETLVQRMLSPNLDGFWQAVHEFEGHYLHSRMPMSDKYSI